MMQLQKNSGGQLLKKLNNLGFVRIGILIIVLFTVVLGFLVWWKDAAGPVDNKDMQPILFKIQKGEGVKSIIYRLSKERLIRSPSAFFLYIKLSHLEKDLQAGDFRLNRGMDSNTIAQELTHGTLDVWVTLLEGWRKEEVAARLSKDLDIPESEFILHSKEGYLFPDTYLIPKDATAGAVLEVLTNNFNSKVTEEILRGFAAEHLSTSDAVILASIVEREGRTEEDRPMIAGILMNRLQKDWPLQADATLQYILGYQANEKTWWKKELTDYDKKIDSPYNTYLYKGLPKGPISNPGLSSIRAVAFPKKSEYMFYLHDKSGFVHYAKTAEEHAMNVSKYL